MILTSFLCHLIFLLCGLGSFSEFLLERSMFVAMNWTKVHGIVAHHVLSAIVMSEIAEAFICSFHFWVLLLKGCCMY